MIKPLLVCVFLLFAGSVFAEENVSGGKTRTSLFRGNEGTSSEGVLLKAFFPVYDFQASAKFFGETFRSDEVDMDGRFGIGLGYARYHVRSLGFDGSVNYAETRLKSSSDFDEDDVKYLRFEGNVGYAFNSFIVLKAGLNASAIRSNLRELDPFFGAQLGANLQINPMIGIGISYVLMTQVIEERDVDFEYRTAGLEIGTNFTF